MKVKYTRSYFESREEMKKLFSHSNYNTPKVSERKIFEIHIPNTFNTEIKVHNARVRRKRICDISNKCTLLFKYRNLCKFQIIYCVCLVMFYSADTLRVSTEKNYSIFYE